MAFDRVFIPPQRKIKKIALEEHFMTTALAPYSASAESGVAPEPMADFMKRLVDFDALRLEEMDKAGIDISVLSATTPGVQVEPDAKVAVQKAKEVNDFLAKAIQRHPTRYAGFAHLPLQDPAAAASELERAVQQLGFKGRSSMDTPTENIWTTKSSSRYGNARKVWVYPFTCTPPMRQSHLMY